MPDESSTSVVQPAVDGGAAAKESGFLSTPTGRIAAVVGGVVVLGVIVGIAAMIFLTGLAGDVAEDLLTPPSSPTRSESGSDSATGTVAAEGPAAEVAYSQVFTFRNVFNPLLKPLPEPAAASTTGTTTPSATDADGVTPTADNTLYLDGVVTQDDVLMAVLRYNGETYTLGPGESISGTPWEVLRVSSTSVTMLYGDVQVTLSVGQGITK